MASAFASDLLRAISTRQVSVAAQILKKSSAVEPLEPRMVADAVQELHSISTPSAQWQLAAVLIAHAPPPSVSPDSARQLFHFLTSDPTLTQTEFWPANKVGRGGPANGLWRHSLTALMLATRKSPKLWLEQEKKSDLRTVSAAAMLLCNVPFQCDLPTWTLALQMSNEFQASNDENSPALAVAVHAAAVASLALASKTTSQWKSGAAILTQRLMRSKGVSRSFEAGFAAKRLLVTSLKCGSWSVALTLARHIVRGIAADYPAIVRDLQPTAHNESKVEFYRAQRLWAGVMGVAVDLLQDRSPGIATQLATTLVEKAQGLGTHKRVREALPTSFRLSLASEELKAVWKNDESMQLKRQPRKKQPSESSSIGIVSGLHSKFKVDPITLLNDTTSIAIPEPSDDDNYSSLISANDVPFTSSETGSLFSSVSKASIYSALSAADAGNWAAALSVALRIPSAEEGNADSASSPIAQLRGAVVRSALRQGVSWVDALAVHRMMCDQHGVSTHDESSFLDALLTGNQWRGALSLCFNMRDCAEGLSTVLRSQATTMPWNIGLTVLQSAWSLISQPVARQQLVSSFVVRCARQGASEVAVRLFRRMMFHRLTPTAAAVAAVLRTASSDAAVSEIVDAVFPLLKYAEAKEIIRLNETWTVALHFASKAVQHTRQEEEGQRIGKDWSEVQRQSIVHVALGCVYNQGKFRGCLGATRSLLQKGVLTIPEEQGGLPQNVASTVLWYFLGYFIRNQARAGSDADPIVVQLANIAAKRRIPPLPTVLLRLAALDPAPENFHAAGWEAVTRALNTHILLAETIPATCAETSTITQSQTTVPTTQENEKAESTMLTNEQCVQLLETAYPGPLAVGMMLRCFHALVMVDGMAKRERDRQKNIQRERQEEEEEIPLWKRSKQRREEQKKRMQAGKKIEKQLSSSAEWIHFDADKEEHSTSVEIQHGTYLRPAHCHRLLEALAATQRQFHANRAANLQSNLEYSVFASTAFDAVELAASNTSPPRERCLGYSGIVGTGVVSKLLSLFPATWEKAATRFDETHRDAIFRSLVKVGKIKLEQ